MGCAPAGERWTEEAGERRRRVYKLTRQGRKMMAAHRSGWETFVRAIGQVVGGEHA
jgi:DNA-binding PadR family transcriptional regulator